MRSIFCKAPYHQQDTLTFCGPAVAQMLLSRYGEPIAQRTLAGKAGEVVGSTGTTPMGVAAMLQANRPPGFVGDFAACSDDDKESGIRRIVRTLISSRLPVPVIVFGSNGHWILITGVALDDGAPDDEAAVQGFYVANPAPMTASLVNDAFKNTYKGPPLPHEAGDNCGKGGFLGGRFAYVSADAWRRHLWPSGAGTGSATTFRWVGNSHVASPAELGDAPVQTFVPPLMTVPPSSTLEAALFAVRRSGLDTCEPFTALLGDARPVEVFPHQIETETADAWDLVTFEGSAGPAGAVFLDASGHLMAAMAPISKVATATEALSYFLGELQLGAREFSEVLGDTASAGLPFVRPVRYWRPCYQSMSPFDSFAVVEGANGRTYYVLPNVGYWRELDEPRCTPSAARRGPVGFIVGR